MIDALFPGSRTNLFNNDPPVTPQVVTVASAAGAPFDDRAGRFITGGARFKF